MSKDNSFWKQWCLISSVIIGSIHIADSFAFSLLSFPPFFSPPNFF